MENEKEVVLSVRNLKINFSTDHGYVQAVRGVNFDLYRGETLCIVGESGSGKSVTSKTIMGILAANGRIVDGSIMYEGEDLTKVSEDEFHRIRGHKIGMIFQDPLSSLNPIMRIGQQVTEAMLINSSRLKKMYDDLVAKELVAYKNAETEKRSGILVAKEGYEFLVSEKKKVANQIKMHATEMAEGKLYNLKREHTHDIEKLQAEPLMEDPNDPEVKKAALNARKAEIARLNEEYRKEVAEINALRKQESSEAKAKLKASNAEYDAKIAEAKANYKKVKAEMAEKYDPIIKENKAVFNAKSKEAKAQVKEYADNLKKEYDAKINPLKIQKMEATTQHAKDGIQAQIDALQAEYVSKTKITKKEAKERAIRIMSEVGISEPERRFRQYPFEFSGGMRQRIVIAIALTADPDVLICDEPTTALDVTIQAQILELINRLKKERNLSCIFITHDLGVVANMADRVAVMYAGKIVEYGTENDIFYDPRHPYTWALLSSIPDIDSKEKLEAIPGTPPNMIYPPKGDAFALRSKYAMAVDFKKEPPMFKISDTHYAATWLLDPRAPKAEMPAIVSTRIKHSLENAKMKEGK